MLVPDHQPYPINIEIAKGDFSHKCAPQGIRLDFRETQFEVYSQWNIYIKKN